ncbi:transcription antitermination factor NusB [Acetobacter sp. AN02]|uniref:transcription antitermination factor NusB n=1 Tax=Acetobacter sp. AN02 TaxID=2894186 RepID=UPI0024346535|nr:transcription antitermination factor NusB [Acetobacter sp. AN02]MDG6095342.1 transcription antitermination factor NusB [Acetobacter sp. AN02]
MAEEQDVAHEEHLGRASRPRTAARVAAVQALFQIGQTGVLPDTAIIQFERFRFGVTVSGDSYEEGQIPEPDAKLFGTIVRTAMLRKEETDTKLSATLPSSWPLTRLDPVLYAILLAAVTELDMPDQPPAGVIINEYLDVAHGFFSGDEPKLINGVLDTLARRRGKTDDEAAS